MDITSWGRRGAVRGVSFLLAAFLVVGGLAIQKHMEADAYKNLLALGYRHAFAELSDDLNALSVDLQKGTYSTSPSMIGALCTQIYGRATAAQMALGELPYGNVELEQTAAFLAKTGDYAAYLSKAAGLNGGCSPEERQNLKALAGGAQNLAAKVASLESDLMAGAHRLEDVRQAELRLSAAVEGGGAETAGSSFQTIESDFPSLPSLIYDGPFSEHIAGRSPLVLADLPQVSPDEARMAAGAFLGLKPSIFTLTSSGGGSLPVYGFSAKVDGGETYLEVSRAGGRVVELLSSRAVNEATLTRDQGLQIAADFLLSQGYPFMRQTYTVEQGNVLTVNFAFVQGEVLCYPDLIKVSVALDNGRIVGFECKGYLMNHTQHDFPGAQISAEAARAVVAPELAVLSYQLALIPTGGEYEVLTHEFKCQTEDGRHIIVYVNALTGQEEKILILLEDESGTLVM